MTALSVLRFSLASGMLVLAASVARAQAGFPDDVESREDREELLLEAVTAAVRSRDLHEPSVLRGHDPRHASAVDRRAARFLRGKRVTLSFEDAPVSDVLDTLQAISGLTFMTSSRARRELATGGGATSGSREREPGNAARPPGRRRETERRPEKRQPQEEGPEGEQGAEARPEPARGDEPSREEETTPGSPRSRPAGIRPVERTRAREGALRDGPQPGAPERSPHEAERAVTIAATNLTLESFLNALAFRLGDHRFTLREGIVFLVHKDEVKPRRVLRVYDVSDLVRPRPDFAAPRLGLGGMELEEGF